MRSFLSLSTVFRFRLESIDINALYLQSGSVTSDLYVRLLTDYKHKLGLEWKLQKLPYGVCEARRQWPETIEIMLIQQRRFQWFLSVLQLFIRCKENRTISLLCGKLTDDLLLVDARNEITNFGAATHAKFSSEKFVIDNPIDFNGCVITQIDKSDIKLWSSQFLKNVKGLLITSSTLRDSEKAVDT